MAPNLDKCFFKDKIPAKLVMDMVYAPMETELLKRARSQRAVVVPGIEMFIEQASRQFEIWTGQRAPRAIMEQAAFEALNGKAVPTAGTK
ncbi:MAG: hypothetical protein WDO18_08535 [Acidobacteriota bacterium]